MFGKTALAAAAVGALFSTTAFARDAGVEPARMTVSTVGVNLASDAGRATIERRIRYAADAVCGDAGSRDLAAAVQARACSANAVTVAQRSLDTAVAQAKSGTQVASLTMSGAANAQ